MRGWQKSSWVAVLVAGSLLTGCSSSGNKERIAALEAENRRLNDLLGNTQGEIGSATRARDELNRRLAELAAENASLRTQLANVPPPQEVMAPSGWTAVPGGAMIAIEDDVLFAPGKIVLRDDARRTLDRIVSTLNGEYGDKDIFVFGHTDDQPIKKSGWQDNWQLSSERSLAVARHLLGHGISPSRVVAAGCSEYRPRAANNSEANRKTNRRVEIFAIDPSISSGRR